MLRNKIIPGGGITPVILQELDDICERGRAVRVCRSALPTVLLSKKNPYNLLKLHGFNNLVPRVGLEPTRGLARWILNPLRLPIPPPRLRACNLSRLYDKGKRCRRRDGDCLFYFPGRRPGWVFCPISATGSLYDAAQYFALLRMVYFGCE
jgi:hypothetical protein